MCLFGSAALTAETPDNPVKLATLWATHLTYPPLKGVNVLWANLAITLKIPIGHSLHERNV